jgi:hypothetical protein
MLHACFYTICLVFRYTLWHFYAISGTNLLTRCHSASSLFSAVFVFQKSYTGNILGIGRNKSRTSRYLTKLPEDRRRAGGGARGRPHHEGARPRPWSRRPMVRSPWSTPDDAPSPIRSLGMENPKENRRFSQNSSAAPPPSKTNFGGQKSLFRHPAGTGKCPRSHPHRSPSPSPPSPSTLLSPMMRRE